MIHNFHFVLNKKLKDNIVKYAESKNMSLSKTVIYIFNFMKPVLEKHYLKEVICKFTEYSYINANEDLHVFFENSDYKYLKQIQSNLYCFSMAMILRYALNVFFDGVNKFGFKRFCVVVGKFGEIYLKKNFNVSEKSFKQHMFYSVQNFEYILHVFDSDYNLITTKFT